MNVENSFPPILRRDALVAMIGLSRATIDRLENTGRFPRRFSLAGGRAVGWRGDEIAAWIAERAATRAGQP